MFFQACSIKFTFISTFAVTCNKGLTLVSNAFDVFAAQWKITSAPSVTLLQNSAVCKSPFKCSTFSQPLKSSLKFLPKVTARIFVYPCSHRDLINLDPMNPLAPVTKILSVFFIFFYLNISQFKTTSFANFLVNMDDVCPYQLFSKYFFCPSISNPFISLHITFGRL